MDLNLSLAFSIALKKVNKDLSLYQNVFCLKRKKKLVKEIIGFVPKESRHVFAIVY